MHVSMCKMMWLYWNLWRHRKGHEFHIKLLYQLQKAIIFFLITIDIYQLKNHNKNYSLEMVLKSEI